MAKDIKNLKEAVSLVISGIETFHKAKADGKIGVEDLVLLVNMVPVIGPAIEGIGEIPSELADLSAEEVAELAAFVMSSNSIVDSEKAKLLISGGFKVIGGVVEIMKGIKA